MLDAILHNTYNYLCVCSICGGGVISLYSAMLLLRNKIKEREKR